MEENDHPNEDVTPTPEPVEEPAAPPPPPPAPQPPAVETPPAEPSTPTPPPPGPAPAMGATDKNKVVAGVLGILLGWLGVHKFYLGYTTEGIIMAAVSVVSFGTLSFIPAVIGLVEGIIYLTKTDEEFYQTYVANKKGWF